MINRLSITVNSFVGEKGAEYFNNEDIQHIYVEYNFLGKFKLWLSTSELGSTPNVGAGVDNAGFLRLTS